MIKFYTTLLVTVMISALCSATDYTIVTQGLSYSPAELTVQIGDFVTIVASGNHPTTEVGEAAWNSNQLVPLVDGFGTNTSTFTFEITDPGVIYYVCDNHIASGMKGRITVEALGVEELSNQINVDFGKLPIEGGRLSYRISGSENDLGSLDLINLGGRTIASQSLNSNAGQLQLNVSSGIYIAVIRDKNGRVIFKQSLSVK